MFNIKSVSTDLRHPRKMSLTDFYSRITRNKQKSGISKLYSQFHKAKLITDSFEWFNIWPDTTHEVGINFKDSK